MSKVTTGADRTPHDLSHFVFSAGKIGRLKVLSFQNLLAGDSLEMNTIGSFRLSPLKRGLALDTCLEFFTFYIPYRHIYGAEWIDLMRNGVSYGANPNLSTVDNYLANYEISFLGTHSPESKKCPRWLYEGYLQIYNNYFKLPTSADYATELKHIPNEDRYYGFACNHLKTLWSAPLPSSTTESYVDTSPVTNNVAQLDIMKLNAAYGRLNTVQEREFFMTRYRDIMESFGGHATTDADNRPQLLMRSKFWSSGYDVNGTDQSTLGTFSGRVQQTFNHKLPRWYCREHGVVMTLVLCRFPPIAINEVNYLVANPNINYDEISGDPSIIGNSIPVELDAKYILQGSGNNDKLRVPAGQHYRYRNSHVDKHYIDAKNYPFINPKGSGDNVCRINSDDYKNIFLQNSLAHWNIQCKFNDVVYRRLPTARDSIMTS